MKTPKNTTPRPGIPADESPVADKHSSTALVSARKLAAAIGISPTAVLRLFRDGIIPAEVAEGRLIRFNADRCRKILADRAADQQAARDVNKPSKFDGVLLRTF